MDKTERQTPPPHGIMNTCIKCGKLRRALGKEFNEKYIQEEDGDFIVVRCADCGFEWLEQTREKLSPDEYSDEYSKVWAKARERGLRPDELEYFMQLEILRCQELAAAAIRSQSKRAKT